MHRRTGQQTTNRQRDWPHLAETVFAQIVHESRCDQVVNVCRQKFSLLQSRTDVCTPRARAPIARKRTGAVGSVDNMRCSVRRDVNKQTSNPRAAAKAGCTHRRRFHGRCVPRTRRRSAAWRATSCCRYRSSESPSASNTIASSLCINATPHAHIQRFPTQHTQQIVTIPMGRHSYICAGE